VASLAEVHFRLTETDDDRWAVAVNVELKL
jgi:hypothetical protein